ncbi:MAG: Domain of uncharacterized function [Actinomycetia bacterium]|nr:Domain of uncharacterized function [Actinomycetes bacterium]
MTDLSNATWRKSSHSGGGNDCVELAGTTSAIAVRDSKNTSGPALSFTRIEWRSFAARIKRSELDR